MNDQSQTDTASRFSFIIDGAWMPIRSHDYCRDCATGRDYAIELLNYMERTQNPVVFGAVVREMILSGDPAGGVEIGFCSVIASRLMNRDIP